MTNARTEEVLKRVDRYLNLMRYEQESVERLSRYKLLKDYYATKQENFTEEVCSTNIQIAEQLSGKMVLPLKVRGVFLTQGRPKNRWYIAEEMEKAVLNPINRKFPLMLDHRDKEASMVVGMVTKIEYDPVLKGIRWWGHINDETFARNVLDGAIKEVSATIYAQNEYDPELGAVGRDLTFKELSLVMEGADEGNYIESY